MTGCSVATRVSPIPINGGENLSADAATAATTLVANTSIGPAGENDQRAGLVDTHVTGMGTSPPIAAYQWRGWMVFVTADRKVWALAEGAPTTAIALSDATAATQLAGTQRPVFSEDGLPQLVIAGGGAPLRWTGAGLCSALVTSGLTTIAPTHIAYLGERFIANDLANPTNWYWSDPFDGQHQSWPALNFDTADASPDNIVGVYSTIREAYIFGEKSLQVYTVGSDPLNPFDNAITQAVGCSAPYSPVNADGSWMFLDDRRRIVVSDGRQFEDVATDLSKSLRNFSTVSDCWSFREDIDHDTFYVFQFPTEGREFYLDTDKKAWMERDYYAPTGRTLLPYRSHAFWPAFNAHYFGSSTTGAAYKWDIDTRTDLGQPLVMERITGWLDHGSNNRKRSIRVRARLRRGTGTATTEELFEVRVADDGGPWGEWEQVPLGISGENEQVYDAYVGGIFRQRRYQFRYSGTSGTALLGVSDEIEDLES
jgi:hypothetical protein